MKIDWSDTYKIDDAEIDAQHEQWFAEINQFLKASDKESLILCEVKMYRYTRVHFAHEEELMKSIGYPDLQIHVRHHNELLAKLNEIAFRIADNTMDMQGWKDFLSSWLVNHIATIDTKLTAYVKAN
jgi:hemerythrin